VARVVTALEPHHTLGALSEPVNQFALALVSPLGSYDHYISTGLYIHWLASLNCSDAPGGITL